MTDRFTMDVLREAFFAVTDEMFVSLQRTSQSPVIYEVLDFAVGLTDASGELVSQGNGIAGFLGPLGEATRDTLVRVQKLRALKLKSVLWQMAERGQIIELRCEMPHCYCPKGRSWFETPAMSKD